MDKRDVLEKKTLQLRRTVKDHQLQSFHSRDDETQFKILDNLLKVQYEFIAEPELECGISLFPDCITFMFKIIHHSTPSLKLLRAQSSRMLGEALSTPWLPVGRMLGIEHVDP